MKNKKIKPKNKPEASVVFAEIESKLPEDLVLKSVKTKTGIAVYTKYFVKTRPYYIKKQYKALSGGKKKLEYSFYDVFSTIFQGTSGRIQEEHKQLIKLLSVQDGSALFNQVCGKYRQDEFSYEDEFDEDSVVGASSVVITKPKDKTKEERLQHKIKMLQNFAEYAGVTPSVYFKYFNYKMHEFFRSTEDDKFIVKYCLKYSNFGCRLDPFLETYYYKNRNMFLKLMNSQYSTLIPFVLKQTEFSLLRLVKLGLHKNSFHKNVNINRCMRYKENSILLDNLKNVPTGVIRLVGNFCEGVGIAPLHLPKWIQHEKQQNKVNYKNINVEALYKKYVEAIKEVKEMLIFPNIEDIYPEVTKIVDYTKTYQGNNEVYKDTLYLGEFKITKKLMRYIEALHNLPADFIVKEITEMGKYGLAVQLRFKDQRKPINIQVVYNIEVEE